MSRYRGTHERPSEKDDPRATGIRHWMAAANMLAGTAIGGALDIIAAHNNVHTDIAPITAGVALATEGAAALAAKSSMERSRARKLVTAVGAVAGGSLLTYVGSRYGWAPHNAAGYATLAAEGMAGGAVGGYGAAEISIDYDTAEDATPAPAYSAPSLPAAPVAPGRHAHIDDAPSVAPAASELWADEVLTREETTALIAGHRDQEQRVPEPPPSLFPPELMAGFQLNGGGQ